MNELQKVLVPIIRQKMADNIAKTIIGAQPMQNDLHGAFLAGVYMENGGMRRNKTYGDEVEEWKVEPIILVACNQGGHVMNVYPFPESTTSHDLAVMMSEEFQRNNVHFDLYLYGYHYSLEFTKSEIGRIASSMGVPNGLESFVTVMAEKIQTNREQHAAFFDTENPPANAT